MLRNSNSAQKKLLGDVREGQRKGDMAQGVLNEYQFQK